MEYKITEIGIYMYICMYVDNNVYKALFKQLIRKKKKTEKKKLL